MITQKTDQLLLLFTPLHKIKIWEKNKYCQKYKVESWLLFIFLLGAPPFPNNNLCDKYLVKMKDYSLEIEVHKK